MNIVIYYRKDIQRVLVEKVLDESDLVRETY